MRGSIKLQTFREKGMRRGWTCAICAAALAVVLSHPASSSEDVGASEAAGAPEAVGAPEAAAAASPRSPGNASYQIEATLDTESKLISGRQTLTWRNIQERPTDELWFHLYWNAWRNTRSTWMLWERLGDKSELGDDVGEDDWAYLDVESVKLLSNEAGAPIDLSDRMRFASPDDGNPDDRTVLVVDLPQPVPPGGTVRLEMIWTARVPRTFDRTGFRGDFYFLAHWFPKLGVLEADGWNCHQFQVRTEFYSDYGAYDVSITLPSEYVLGATGREAGRTDNGDGTTTHRYTQEDVHEFAWTASPDYLVREARFEEPGLPPIDMRLLIQPEHLGQVERHFAAARAAFKYFGEWYGPYPYGHVTLVDPAYGSGAGGMEYPTLFTCGTRIFNPFRGGSPEGVTIHEAGHQFWYGLVGNNEFEHAWIDEGFDTFSTTRTLEHAYEPNLYVRRYIPRPGESSYGAFIPVMFPDIEVPRWGSMVAGYRPSAHGDDPEIPSYRYFPETAYGPRCGSRRSSATWGGSPCRRSSPPSSSGTASSIRTLETSSRSSGRSPDGISTGSSIRSISARRSSTTRSIRSPANRRRSRD
jgi:hypothetical protein